MRYSAVQTTGALKKMPDSSHYYWMQLSDRWSVSSSAHILLFGSLIGTLVIGVTK